MEFGIIRSYSGTTHVILPTYLNNAIIICNALGLNDKKLSCVNIDTQSITANTIETMIFAPDPTVIPLSTDTSTYKNIDQYTFYNPFGSDYVVPPHSYMRNPFDGLYNNYISGFYVSEPEIDFGYYGLDSELYINEAASIKFWLAIGNLPKPNQKLIYINPDTFNNPSTMIENGHWIYKPGDPNDVSNHNHRLATDEEYNILPD